MRHKALPHVKPVKAKGKTYYYFRTGEMSSSGSEIRKRLPDPSDVAAFGSVYAALLAARSRRDAAKSELTFPELCDLWENCPRFRKYAPGTQKLYRISLAHVRPLLPTAPAGLVEQQDIVRIVDAMADRPGAVNSVLRTLKSLYKWGRRGGLVSNDPARQVDELEIGEHAPWQSHVLEAALAAEDNWRIRLGVHLLYYTTQRIEDVVTMRWSDIDEHGILHVVQQKTKRQLEIPVHRELAAELERQDQGRSPYIIPGFKKDKPLHQSTLRDDIQDWVFKRFGVDVVPHGLRKNGVNKLLEVGCGTGETSSISGQSLKMVEHYAKQRAQGKMARAAITRWEKHEDENG